MYTTNRRTRRCRRRRSSPFRNVTSTTCNNKFYTHSRLDLLAVSLLCFRSDAGATSPSSSLNIYLCLSSTPHCSSCSLTVMASAGMRAAAASSIGFKVPQSNQRDRRRRRTASGASREENRRKFKHWFDLNDIGKHGLLCICIYI